MNAERPDHPEVIAPPPLIYTAALMVGLLLHTAFPVRFLPDGLTPILGWPLIGIAVLLAAWAFRVMRRAGTNVNPAKPTTVLAVVGPFRFTRNPLYVALTLFYMGIAIRVNALWAIALLPVVLWIIHRGVIAREERYLEEKFGEEYSRYKARVRRWI